MTKQSQHELFAQRPVRSDFARSRGGGGLNLRKLLFVCVILFAAIGIGFAVNSLNRDSSSSEEIPTIHAETPLKLRPEEPGGIDIPHQDLSVFQKLDASEAKPQKPGIEHLLPEPETPQAVTDTPVVVKTDDAPSALAPAPEAQPTQKVEELPPAITEAEPVKAVPAPKVAEPVPASATVKKEPEKKVAEKEKAVTDKIAVAMDAAKKVEKNVKTEPAEVKKVDATPVGRLPKEMFTADAFTPPKTVETPVAAEKTTTSPVSPSADKSSAKKPQIQIASYPSEAHAQSELKMFQNKYAGILGTVALHIVKAEISGKGTYYRLMASVPTESKAKTICADIVKQKGNCIVVK